MTPRRERMASPPSRRAGRVLALSAGAVILVLVPLLLAAAMFWRIDVSSEAQWLGMEVEPLTPSMGAALGIAPGQPGVFVSDVVGLAYASGIREGDVILGVNGKA